MATGMIRWLTIVGGGFLFVAVWLLPPGPLQMPAAREVPDVELRFDALLEDFQVSWEALRRHRFSDSLSELATVRGESSLVLAPDGHGVTDVQLEMIRSRLKDAERALLMREAGMVLGFVLQPVTHGVPAGQGADLRRRRETYAGTRNGITYCLQLQTATPGRIGEEVAAALVGSDFVQMMLRDPLGACRWYAQYGLPGVGIESWLELGGLALGAASEGRSPAEREALGRVNSRPRRGAMGVTFGSRPAVADLCLTGDASACAEFMTAPALTTRMGAREHEIVRRSPAVSLGNAASAEVLLYDQRYLMADLEAEFGPDTFAEFWRSDADVSVAFKDAFGAELGEWMVSWIDSTVGIDRAGPVLTRSATLGSLLTLTLLAGLSAGIARRRKLS